MNKLSPMGGAAFLLIVVLAFRGAFAFWPDDWQYDVAGNLTGIGFFAPFFICLGAVGVYLKEAEDLRKD